MSGDDGNEWGVGLKLLEDLWALFRDCWDSETLPGAEGVEFRWLVGWLVGFGC